MFESIIKMIITFHLKNDYNCYGMTAATQFQAIILSPQKNSGNRSNCFFIKSFSIRIEFENIDT